jgi:hypothetical protein
LRYLATRHEAPGHTPLGRPAYVDHRVRGLPALLRALSSG